MNIFLWVLQALLAVHTLMGAVWKFKNTPEQTMPTLKAIPLATWKALGIFEILCAIGLVLPAIYTPARSWVSTSAIGIALVMVAFCALHLRSRAKDFGPMIYWLAVAAVCAFVAYGRFEI